jgi:hypothetical protein
LSHFRFSQKDLHSLSIFRILVYTHSLIRTKMRVSLHLRVQYIIYVLRSLLPEPLRLAIISCTCPQVHYNSLIIDSDSQSK